jgi:parvulin-like peptidyl-prolyl isomerase
MENFNTNSRFCKNRLVGCCVVALMIAIQLLHSLRTDAQNIFNVDGISTQDSVVAKVNGLTITAREIDTVVRNRTKDRNVDPQTIASFQAELLNQLIDQRLVYLFLLDSKYRITDQELLAAIEQRRAKLKETEKGVSLEKSLQVMGITMDNLKMRLLSELSWKRYIQELANSPKLNEYFEQNKTKFDGSKIRVSHIILRPVRSGEVAELIELAKTMEQIREDIVTDKISFTDAVKKYSMGPSRRDGGDLGIISRSGPMAEQFSKAAFDLKKGEVSPVVLTAYGLHLITVTGIREGTAKLDEVKNEVLAAFEADVFQKTIVELGKKATIEYQPNYPHIDRTTKKLILPASGVNTFK